MPKIIKEKEETIEDKILFYLNNHGISANKVVSEGFYNAKKGIYQKRKSEYASPGISDIVGCISPHGRALYIEVKRPEEMARADRPSTILARELLEARYDKKLSKSSLRGYQHRYEQAKFIEEKRASGAVAFFSSSVEQTKERLGLHI